MSTIFQITGPNTGKDVDVLISVSNIGINQTAQSGTGGPWDAGSLGILTHFSVDTDYSMMESKSIQNDGEVYYESIPHGAKCSLKLQRAGGSAGAGLEDIESFYRGQAKTGNPPTFSIQYTTLNRDGSSQTRTLVGCKPHNWKLGEYKADQFVEQSVDFVCADLLDNS